MLTLERAGYTLRSLDSRWKIAVPRLGPAIIATRHTPEPSAVASHPRLYPLPYSPPPLGDPQSAVHDLVIHPRYHPLTLPVSDDPLRSSSSSSSSTATSFSSSSPERNPVDFTFVPRARFGQRDKSSGGGSRRFSRVAPGSDEQCGVEESRVELNCCVIPEVVGEIFRRNFCHRDRSLVGSSRFFRRTSFAS